MSLIGLVTLVTEKGDDFVIDAYNNIDEAQRVVNDLIFETCNPNYYVQYVELKGEK